MATYAIGDIHGCWRTFRRLLDRIGFNARQDRVWLVGDLVNKGPHSALVLRWMIDHDACVTAVLGNHDLHLLSIAAGAARRGRGDTMGDVLEAPDRDELLGWLRKRPLIHGEGNLVLVHAGIWPTWTISQAFELAGGVSARLAGETSGPFLRAYARGRLESWDGTRPVPDRDVAAAAIFTQLRYVGRAGKECLEFTGPPREAADDCRPWIDLLGPQLLGRTFVFGHWAALGFFNRHDAVCLDSRCVYGGELTAVRLDDRRIFSEPLADEIPSSSGPTTKERKDTGR